MLKTVQKRSEIISSTPLGAFEVFPRELLHAFFDRVPVAQLVNLTLLSKTLNKEIRWYILFGGTCRRFAAVTSEFIARQDLFKGQDPFYSWGKLLKAATITLSFQIRHHFLASFFCKNESGENWYGWGRCFMAFSESWTWGQREELLRSIMHFSGLNDLLNVVMTHNTGKFPHMEMEIRRRIRGFFLSQFNRDQVDYDFWHSVVLRSQRTAERQGKLLMIICGPLMLHRSGYLIIDWELFGQMIIGSPVLCETLIGPLSWSLSSLAFPGRLEEYTWSYLEIYNLIEEISLSPAPWMLTNFAALLALQPKLIFIAVHIRIVSGYDSEAAHILHSVICVLLKWDFSWKVVADIIVKLFLYLSPQYRRPFLLSLWKDQQGRIRQALYAVPFSADDYHMEMAILKFIVPLMVLINDVHVNHSKSNVNPTV